MTAPAWMPAPERRSAITRRLTAASGEMTSAALADMSRKYGWISELEAEHRSWINIVVRAGVDGFVRWFSEGAGDLTDDNIFDAAPSPLQRMISLQQTVDLIRSTIATVEEQLATLMPPDDRDVCRTAIMHYSREVAFDAAEVYARAAEIRGAWDARVEAMVMDAVVRGEVDEIVLARTSALGWTQHPGIAAVVGDLRDAKEGSLRRTAQRVGADVLLAPQGDRLLVLSGGDFRGDEDARAFAGHLAEFFGPGPVVVGHVVGDLASAVGSARAALSGHRAAPAWPAAPRPVLARELLPERALSGDGHARRSLARTVHGALSAQQTDLLATLEAFLEEGTIEATARRLFIHPNTVRYRLGRIEDVTGYRPADARDGYALRLGMSLGRILG